ncbi:MAG: AEC family transporter [Alphaproteobacteria bacterium]|nr:AEC family transporter [Alphaproteobacteria bacterium]
MNIAQLLLPDFSLILCGYLICRYTRLGRSIWQPVESLVYFFLFPVLLFHSISRAPLDLVAASSMIGAGLTLGLSGIALSYALPHLPVLRGHFSPHQHAGAAQVAFRFNSFFGLALAERLLGPAGVQQFAVLIGFCVPMFNVAAVWPMARQGSQGLARELSRNPLIMATLGGLAFNLAGLHIPDWLSPTLGRIGQSSIPLGLMAAGAGLELHRLGQGRVLTLALLCIKHLLMPVCAWGLATIWGLDPLQTTVLLVFSALPTASSCYVLSARMGFDGPYVAGLVTLSTLAAAGSLPFALGVLRAW